MPIASPARRAATTAATSALLVAMAGVVLLVGCKRDAEPDTTASSPGLPSADARALFPPDQDSERTWVGLLPCSDCQGVDTRLVLRAQGARRDYLMTETYLASDGGKRFSRAGAWTEAHVAGDGGETIVYQLDPERAGERFSLQADGALELLGGDGKPPPDALAYRLQRL